MNGIDFVARDKENIHCSDLGTTTVSVNISTIIDILKLDKYT